MNSAKKAKRGGWLLDPEQQTAEVSTISPAPSPAPPPRTSSGGAAPNPIRVVEHFHRIPAFLTNLVPTSAEIRIKPVPADSARIEVFLLDQLAML